MRSDTVDSLKKMLQVDRYHTSRASPIGSNKLSDVFKLPQNVVWTDLGGGNLRAVLSDRPELMMVAFAFPKDGVGALHSHPHVQASFVAEGRFEVTIEGETQVIDQGGSFIVPPGALHGVRALERGLLVDAFTPRRDDFL